MCGSINWQQQHTERGAIAGSIQESGGGVGRGWVGGRLAAVYTGSGSIRERGDGQGGAMVGGIQIER